MAKLVVSYLNNRYHHVKGSVLPRDTLAFPVFGIYWGCSCHAVNSRWTYWRPNISNRCSTRQTKSLFSHVRMWALSSIWPDRPTPIYFFENYNQPRILRSRPKKWNVLRWITSCKLNICPIRQDKTTTVIFRLYFKAIVKPISKSLSNFEIKSKYYSDLSRLVW